MEMFCLPLEEIRDRFTLSEIALMGWRSQEQVFKMKRKMDRNRTDWESQDYEPTEMPKTKNRSKPKKKKEYDGHVPEGLPERFYDEEGEVNLSKVKLQDALKYLNGQGFKFPMKVVQDN